MNAPTSLENFATVRPADHPAVRAGKVGVLIVNLGTPEATDYWSMRRYLKEFLSDKRVIETPRWIWWPILHLIILTRRPSAKGKDYDAIWNKERNEGPLKTITRAQALKLAERVIGGGAKREIVVDWAMRYGKPSIAERLNALHRQGCDRILLVPLYPQYCAATSATVCDKAFDALKAMRWQPALRVAAPYYDAPAYIDALASRPAPRWLSWISSRKSSSPRSMAFPRAISTPAIPISAIAPRRRDCCAKNSACRRKSCA